ncbi:MAG: DUF1801 domain-containing protein [Chitinophagales bacterium]|nr:DUF1801 domain-containing protein [Chitinophagales bacterium]
MPENKTKPTEQSVDAFLDAVEHPRRREDGKAVCAMMQEITGKPPVMWGPSIIGFGKVHYKYDSGHEGDMPMVAFSPRRQALTLYVLTNHEAVNDLMPKLGKYKTSKACLYINNLRDVDQEVLRELIDRSYKAMFHADHCIVCKD